MASVDVGNAMPMAVIPLGSIVHNIELTLGRGGQIARASGTYAQIVAKENKFVTVRLPSAEVRLIDKRCYATLGQVGNVDHVNVKVGKAGRSRWLGKKSKVRGVVKNPVDPKEEARQRAQKTKEMQADMNKIEDNKNMMMSASMNIYKMSVLQAQRTATKLRADL